MDLLQVGQKLSLNIEKQSKLIEIIGTISELFSDRMIIDLPPYFMRYIEFLDVGKLLTIKVFSKVGTIDFNTVVISSPLEDGSITIELDYNALKLTPGNQIPKVDAIEHLSIMRDGTVINTQTFEIATEYIKFYCDKKLNIDESFDCKLKLPDDYGTISFRITISEIDTVYNNEYTATYYAMSEKYREVLLYYIYVYTNNSSQE